MKLFKFCKTVGICTILAVVYIHVQMQTFHLAYQATDKEKTIRRLNEIKGNLTYSILSLKSASNLGIAMFAEDSDMQFTDAENIVQISMPSGRLSEKVVKKDAPIDRENSLLSFIPSFGTQAEAKNR